LKLKYPGYFAVTEIVVVSFGAVKVCANVPPDEARVRGVDCWPFVAETSIEVGS
jgi:hypothetical protein